VLREIAGGVAESIARVRVVVTGQLEPGWETEQGESARSSRSSPTRSPSCAGLPTGEQEPTGGGDGGSGGGGRTCLARTVIGAGGRGGASCDDFGEEPF
jgi:hypothetical protein